MKTYRFLIWLLMFLTLPVMAQRRKARRLSPEQQAQQAKINRMTANTQRVMFIDSIVVDKQQFLDHYHLSPEVGRIVPYQEFFKTRQQPDSYVFINELGNRIFLSQEAADSTINLYSSEIMSDSWTHAEALNGINDNKQFKKANYPFMMGDGQTFYFAATGSEGLGGYDIYVTRYDPEEKQFLKPANIGMPFNSEANDYMYVIDEYTNLGWFATDRRQPADSVCIYIFEPSQTRQKYSTLGLSTEETATYARIDRIADTWFDSLAYSAAVKRLEEIRQPKLTAQPQVQFRFVINDQVIYTRLTDFRVPDNVQRYKQLAELHKRYDHLLSTLERARTYFSTTSLAERAELRPEILATEQKQHELYNSIRELEKTIRNAENTYLTKHP